MLARWVRVRGRLLAASGVATFLVCFASAQKAEASPPDDVAPQVDLPGRDDKRLVVGSYNIKWLGSAKHDLPALARVIANFDVCGVVEVKEEWAVRELERLLELDTGEKWSHIYGFRTTNSNEGGSYYEASAVLWRSDRAELTGLVGGVWDKHQAFRQDPFVASFRSGGFDFILVLVHTRWTTTAGRRGEVAELARQLNWIAGYLSEQDIVVAGDFNYDALKTPEMVELQDDAHLALATGNGPTSIGSGGPKNAYDHIFVSLPTHAREFQVGGVLDPRESAYPQGVSWADAKGLLSDHLPVWASFRTDVTDDD